MTEFFARPLARTVLGAVLLVMAAMQLGRPAIAAPTSQRQERLVVLEMFGRTDCIVCEEHAGPAMDALVAQYEAEGRRVVIFEHDSDNSGNLGMAERRRRWFRLMGVSRAPLPLVLLNGGLETAFGTVDDGDYQAAYRAMIDRAAQGEPTARVTASWAPTGASTFQASVNVENTGESDIDPRAGGGIWMFAIRAERVLHAGRYAAGVGRLPLAERIAPGASVSTVGDVTVDEGTDLSTLQILAVVERVLPDGRWDVAQGAVAVLDRDAPTPAPTPVPTREPGETPVAEIHLPLVRR